jgi:acyl-CoA reductase-like NAD-dependent aldehyde dehydrogenase
MTTTNKLQPVLIDGQWINEATSHSFSSKDPNTSESIGLSYPVSSWATCELALRAAHRAFQISRNLEPSKIAAFLEDFASRI